MLRSTWPLAFMKKQGAAGGGGGGTPHRYWRILSGKNSGAAETSCGLREVEMRTSAGGADVCTGGTASADSAFSGSFPASNAFDNTNATWYTTETPHPHWLAYDFGAGNEKDIVEVAINADDTSKAFGAFKVQYSDDGSDWYDSWWVAYPGGTNGHSYVTGTLKTFTKPGTTQSPTANRHRYWQLLISGSNGGSFVRATDIELRTIVNGPDETYGGTASASSNFSGLTPDKGFGVAGDGDWANNNIGFPEYIRYDFGSGGGAPRAITEVAYTLSSFHSTQGPTAFDLQYSDDGSSWTTLFSSGAITWSAAGTKYFT